jgi:hypothetical protein
MSAYLRQLSYRRIFLLVLAAFQLFPLPDLPGESLISRAVSLVQVLPEITQS